MQSKKNCWIPHRMFSSYNPKAFCFLGIKMEITVTPTQLRESNVNLLLVMERHQPRVTVFWLNQLRRAETLQNVDNHSIIPCLCLSNMWPLVSHVRLRMVHVSHGHKSFALFFLEQHNLQVHPVHVGTHKTNHTQIQIIWNTESTQHLGNGGFTTLWNHFGTHIHSHNPTAA